MPRRPFKVRGGPKGNKRGTPGEWARFRLDRRRGITVLVLTDQTLIKEQHLCELADDLLALVEAKNTIAL